MRKSVLCKPTEFNRTKYKVFRNRLNHLIRLSKKRHFQKRLNDPKADLKSTWKILNELLKCVNKERENSYLASRFTLEDGSEKKIQTHSMIFC